MPAADVEVATDAERAALTELRDLAGEAGGPLERHSLRVALIALEAGRSRQIALDRELVLVAGLLHDAGLLVRAPADGAAYVTDSRTLTDRLAAEHGWDVPRTTRLGDAVELHHTREAQWARGAEVELLRRADVAELTHDRVRSLGLDPGFLARLDAQVPRRGIRGHIVRQVLGQARRRPGSLPRIFRPRG